MSLNDKTEIVANSIVVNQLSQGVIQGITRILDRNQLEHSEVRVN